MPEYFGRLTEAGIAAEAWAKANGAKVSLTHIAIGDGGGDVPTPSGTETTLVHENYRTDIEAFSLDETDHNLAYLSIVIPAEVGGWWIRELGVIAEDPAQPGSYLLYAYFNHAPTYKQLVEAGQATTHELRIPVVYSSDSVLDIHINEAGYALRTEFLKLNSLVEALRNIQRASWTLAEGIAEGGTLSFPDELVYAPGHHAVCLTFDGVSCHEGPQFLELGAEEDGLARGVALQFAAPAGSEFEVLILGHSDAMPLNDAEAANPSGLTARVSALEEQISTVSQLSENAVYLGEMVTEE